MSSIRTDHYMREADGYIKSRQAKVAKRQQPLPPRFRTLLALQSTGGEEKGQWHKSPELMKLLGGYVPDPPKGTHVATRGRWGSGGSEGWWP